MKPFLPLAVIAWTSFACLNLDATKLNAQLPGFLERYRSKYYQISDLSLQLDPSRTHFKPLAFKVNPNEENKATRAFARLFLKTQATAWSFDESALSADIDFKLLDYRKQKDQTQDQVSRIDYNVAFSLKTNVLELAQFLIPQFVAANCSDIVKRQVSEEVEVVTADVCRTLKEGRYLEGGDFDDLIDLFVLSSASAIRGYGHTIRSLQEKQKNAADQEMANQIEVEIQRYRANLDAQIQMNPQVGYEKDGKRRSLLIRLQAGHKIWFKRDVLIDSSFYLTGVGST